MDPQDELDQAIEQDDLALVECALDAGADPNRPNARGYAPLDWAAHIGSGGVVRMLLERGVTGLNLVSAAGAGLSEEIEQMLISGDYGGRRPDPSSPDEHWPIESAYQQHDILGDALFAAARNGHLEVVRRLVEDGANPNARGVFGALSLHWATLFGHAAVVWYLLDLGLDPSECDPHFEADAASWAEEGGFPELATALRV